MSPFASSDSGSPSVTGTSGPTSTVRKIGVEEGFAFVIEIPGLEGRRGRRTEGSAFASGTRAGKLSLAPTRAPEEARQGRRDPRRPCDGKPDLRQSTRQARMWES